MELGRMTLFDKCLDNTISGKRLEARAQVKGFVSQTMRNTFSITVLLKLWFVDQH